MPFAPGTFGTIFGVIIIAFIALLPRFGFPQEWLIPTYILVTISTCIKGFWSSELYAKHTGKKDPKEVVIDEVAGMMISVLVAGLGYWLLYLWKEPVYHVLLAFSPIYLLILFVLFRIFDIAKPLHVGWADQNLKGGVGIMVDDIIAGIYAGITFILLLLLMVETGLMTQLVKIIYPDWVE